MLQNIDHLLRRALQVNVVAVRQQVVIGAGHYGFHQPGAELPLQKAHYLSDPLQRKAALAQLAYNCYFGKIVERV
jgi:hypothetical protein